MRQGLLAEHKRGNSLVIRASCDTLIIDVLGHLCVQLVRKHLLGNIGTVTRNAILLFNLAHRNFHQMRLGSEEGSQENLRETDQFTYGLHCLNFMRSFVTI